MAGEYGWTKDYILDNVYPVEALIYGDLIRERKTADYLMQLMIVSNPHTKKPKRLFRYLKRDLGKQSFGDDTIDRKGLSRLKGKLQRRSKNIKVKA